ncbi:MAG: metalloregulator ArsR/SmtB family transcription factor [Clostridium sp.]|uniref:ArsR/SmtB family transcription factor n=1 Tax=Clostridium sp. TaxID=1506 RepID=UPI00302AC2D2
MINNVKVFKAIGDETRIKILILLSKRNICAKGIARHLEISEAAVSQHIKILKDVELVIGYKKGYHVIYDLNKDILEEAIGFITILINDDICSISDKFNLEVENFNVLQCNNNCKGMKSCCKKRLKEE